MLVYIAISEYFTNVQVFFLFYIYIYESYLETQGIYNHRCASDILT